MKKLILILFIFIHFICHAEYDSTYVLSVTQKYAIPENVSNGDYAGTWMKTLTWKSVGTISFEIEQNYNGAFSVNSSSGLITISDATKINGKVVQQDTLINLVIRTTDSGEGYELDTAKIWVKENAYCHFYDFAGSGAGTRADPDNYLPTGAKQLGHGYFMKRGVTFLNGGTVTFSSHIASETHPTIVAAYGAGTKPMMRSTDDSESSIGFTLGTYITFPYDTDSSLRAENIRFYDLHMQYYYASTIRGNMPSSHFGFYNMDITNCNRRGTDDAFKFYDRAYDDSTWYMPSEMISMRFDTTNSTGLGTGANKAYIKWGAGPLNMTNCWFGPCIDQNAPCWALRLTNGTGPTVSTIKHCYFKPESPDHGSEAGSIQVRQKNVYLLDNVMEGSSNGVYTVVQSTMPGLDSTPHRLHAQNNWFKNNTYRGMIFHQGAASFNPYLGVVIEDNLFTPTSTAIVSITIRDFNGGIIRRNKFVGGIDGLYSSTSEASKNVSVYYNVFYGQSSNAIEYTTGSGHTFYNNTVDGEISLTGVTSPVVSNNFYKLSTANTSKNIDIDDIVTGNYFTDYAGHDYSLRSTATSAIDGGIDLNLTPDIQGTAVGDSPDIGAYEYVPGGGTPTVNISATDANAAEQNQNPGTFTITRNNTSGDITVYYTISGTASANDYTPALSGSFVIPGGSSTATITIVPVGDANPESSEALILTISNNAAYTVGLLSNATVTITDIEIPSVSVSSTDASASEQGTDQGIFTVTRSNTSADLTVNYTVSGSASPNDYTPALSGSVVIPSGSSTATITITPVDDANPENSETLILTISDNAAYTIGSPSFSTVTIADNEPGQLPYGGTAKSIPGTIQIEDFDTGGEGVAYHDIDAANNGGGYRTTEGVDIHLALAEESYKIGWFKNGEWMEYTVNVEAGTYDISIRVGNPNNNRQLKVYLDNSLLTTINVPNTGGSSIYQTATVNNIEISGGNGKILKLENVNNDFDFNWIQFIKTSPTAITSLGKSGTIPVVYPNPFNDILRARNTENVTRAELSNICGKTLLVKQNKKAVEMKIDTKNLKNGVYILRFFDDTEAVSVHKVVK